MTTTKEKKPSKKTKVVFASNVKFGKELYKKGESLEVTETEYESLLEAKVLQQEKGE